MYEVYIKDFSGEWEFYHITTRESAITIKEELSNHPDVYGVEVIPPEEQETPEYEACGALPWGSCATCKVKYCPF